MKHKTALITGASGFVGSSLLKYLPKLGINALPLSRLLLRSNSLKTYLHNRHFDYIFHCASYGNLFDQTDEEETLEVNIGALYNLLDATKHIDYEAFINFSTSSIYLPHVTFYSASKLSGEVIVRAFVNKYNKPIITVRPSTIYGPGDNPKHLIPQVIHNLMAGAKMDIVTKPTHDYIYIDDLISGIMAAAKSANLIMGEAIDISTNKAISNAEIIKTLETISRRKLKMNKIDSMRPYDSLNWKIDNKDIISLGWKPETSLENGLRACFNNYGQQTKNT